MTYIDVHVLQTVPPSNLNRDDTGSPKTAVFGGSRRARVSSQAWKRATRTYFNHRLDRSGIGYRTKRIVELVAAEIGNAGMDAQRAGELAEKVIAATGITVKAPKKKSDPKAAPEPANAAAHSDYLVFISAGQVAKLADLAILADGEGRDVKKNEAQQAFNSDQSIDVALFGRMVADNAELNIDAAAQVAHALSVHVSDNEFDYFTAVDDFQAEDKQTGAGMIGTVEFNSSTLYRYATINIDGLLSNLGNAVATARAAAVFVEAFVRSMPTGKQNTFANRTLPDAVVVAVREDQPVNLVGAFESPVAHGMQGSIVTAAADALANYSDQLNHAYGAPTWAWVAGPSAVTERLATFGSAVTFAELVAHVESTVAESVGVPA